MKYERMSVYPMNQKTGFMDQARFSERNFFCLNKSTTSLHKNLHAFMSREEYLEWKKHWKDLYNQVSQVIRDIRDIRDNKHQKLGQNHYDMIRSYRQADLEEIRGFARQLMNIRDISKLVANYSYLQTAGKLEE